MTRDAYGYASRNPLNLSDPSGLYSADSLDHYANAGYYIQGCGPVRGFSEYRIGSGDHLPDALLPGGAWRSKGPVMNLRQFSQDQLPLDVMHTEGYQFEQYQEIDWSDASGGYYEAQRLVTVTIATTDLIASDPSAACTSVPGCLVTALTLLGQNDDYDTQIGDISVRMYERGAGGTSGTPDLFPG